MKVKPIAEIIEFLKPVADGAGVEIVDAEWNMRTRSLTIYIDAPGGVDLNLCEKFHRAADAPLDELDPTFGESYTLNCSSPGLDRPFKTMRDYEKHIGQKIEVHLYAPLYGKKYHEGELVSFDGEQVIISVSGEELIFPAEKVAKACLFIEV